MTDTLARVRFTSTGNELHGDQDRVDVLPVRFGVSNFLDEALHGDCLVVGFEKTLVLGDYRRTWTLLELARGAG